MQDRTVFDRQYRAWERFLATGRMDASSVRPEVGRSWQRCRSAGLDPRGPKVPVRLRGEELTRLLHRNRRFLDAAALILEYPVQAVRDTPFILVLTDASGIVLASYGDQQVLALAKANNFVPGCSRSETEVGTNAIGLALVERRPIQLFGAEHYNSRHHNWTCSSAPVFDHDGSFLGTVTLSGESHEVHRHTLGLVIAAAEAIQNRLREKLAEQQKSCTDHIARSLVGRMTEPILTINADGEVVYANKGAAGLLGSTESQLGGQKITALLPGARFADLIGADALTQPIEVVCDVSGQRSHFLVRSSTIRDSGEDLVQGAILSLSRRELLKTIRTQSKLAARYRLDDIVGEDPVLRQQLALARLVAARDARVLIIGETGTGKELLAQGIHNASPRAGGPFVALNCAAMPRELIEAELLGYREGAFTGARRGGQIGKFELADGGTLFLDEISQMPLDLQAKLLRVLQDGIVTRLGDTAPVQVDVRVIAATNENLFQKSQTGAFRSDLFFRLSVMELTLPPLRDRGDDITRLAELMLTRAAGKLGKPALAFSAAARACLTRYRWPGNIRELENVVEMAALVCPGPQIAPEHLNARVRQAEAVAPSAAPAVQTPIMVPELAGAAPATLESLEVAAIRRALLEHNCNISHVSRALGISRCTVYRRMRELGLSRTVSLS